MLKVKGGGRWLTRLSGLHVVQHGSFSLALQKWPWKGPEAGRRERQGGREGRPSPFTPLPQGLQGVSTPPRAG